MSSPAAPAPRIPGRAVKALAPAYTYEAEIVRWIDGDTVEACVDLGFHLTAQVHLRVWGVDTPERGQAGHDEATARVRELVPAGCIATVRTYKADDKYGRYLAEVQVPTGEGAMLDVAATLIAEGLGRPYFGGTKVSSVLVATVPSIVPARTPVAAAMSPAGAELEAAPAFDPGNPANTRV